MRLVDSHCHLAGEQFEPDRGQVIERARAVGVERMMVIDTPGLAEQYPFLYSTVGVHPHKASSATPETYLRLRQSALLPKVLAIGEIGLDYHYDFSPRETQRAVFIEHLRIAAEARKPIVIRTREAWSDTLSILRDHWTGPGIMHCFTGTPEQAAEALAIGFHLSFGGVVTFPKAEAVRESARIAPADRLLIETDCPYLAPVPHRGKRNEPAFLIETVRKLAEVRQVPAETIAEVTTVNFEKLFGLLN